LRGETTDPTPWLDDIFRRETIYGSLTLTWRRGVIDAAVMRRRGVYDRFDLAHFRLLVQSRVGQFLRHLSIDATPGIAEGLATLPELPPSLKSICLGYRLGPKLQPHPVPQALKNRCPRLHETPLFFTTPGLKLRSEQQTLALLRPGFLMRGVAGAVTLGEAQRSSSLAVFRIDDGCFTFWPDYEGKTELNSRRVHGPIRLMLGDEIALGEGQRFRVEPNDTHDNHYEAPSRETGEREFGGAL